MSAHMMTVYCNVPLIATNIPPHSENPGLAHAYPIACPIALASFRTLPSETRPRACV